MIEAHPQSAEWRVHRGAIYEEMGDFDKAMAEFTDAIRRNARSVLATVIAHGLYFVRKQIPEAISDLDLAIYLDPEQHRLLLCSGHRIHPRRESGSAPLRTQTS